MLEPDSPSLVHVASVKQVGPQLARLTLDSANSAVASSHTRPGQYTKLAFDSAEVARPYAFASPPGAPFEFLLKLPAERLASVCALTSEDRLLVHAAQGRGFPVERAEGKDLWLVATGTGVAPLRATLDWLLPRRADFGAVTLLYGARHREDLAFVERFGTWAGHDVAVQPVLSRPDDEWDGRRGHVQQHLPQAFKRPEHVVAFVCGLPEMDKATTQALLERGVGNDQVFRNY